MKAQDMKSYKTSRGLLVIITLVVLVATACQPEAAPTATPAPQEPITIGISLPLTGRRESPGNATKQGYEVWAAMVNEAGGLLGREVELVVLDNASDDAIVGADYEKLITEEQVDLVLGTQSSFLNLPASAAAAEHGYAFIGPSAGAPDMFNRGLNNYFFAQPAVAARQADPFALHILGLDTDVRPQTFAVVTGDDPFALGVMERLSSLLIDGELELVMETVYPLETTDFSDIAAEVAEIDPDLIIGGTTFPDSVGQIQAYQEVGYQPRFAYFTSGPSQPTPFREALGDATEGIYSSVSWFPDGKDYQNAEFTAKYIEMFGGTLGDMPEDAANGFTAGQVLRQAVENIESIDNAELIEELRRGTFDTVVGPLNFDDTGAPLGSYMLLQWHGDTFVIVGPEDRAEVDALDPPKPEW